MTSTPKVSQTLQSTLQVSMYIPAAWQARDVVTDLKSLTVDLTNEVVVPAVQVYLVCIAEICSNLNGRARPT